jgi:hypothetical protein
MLLAIVVIATIWLLVAGAVIVLCHAAKQGDAAVRASQRAAGTAGDVVPLVVARRRVARARTTIGSAR